MDLFLSVTLFIPRIGQEVIVSFIDGDPDRPIVTGAVYNGRNFLPYNLPSEKTKSTIKTRSTPGGGGFNEIRFEDKKGQEEIYIHGEKDWNIEILNDKSQTIGHDETLDVGNDRTKSVGNDQFITITRHHTESIGENMSVSVGKNLDESTGENKSVAIGKNLKEETGNDATITVGNNKRLTVSENYSADTVKTVRKTSAKTVW